MTCVLTCLYTNASYSLDLYKSTKPQSTTKTCQSYAAALALASLGDPDYPIESFGELRSVENQFRKLAEKQGSPYSHSTWDKAMSELTKGRYTLERTYKHSNVVDWLDEVKSHTDIDSDIDALLSKLSGGNVSVILTSVYELDGIKYPSGHIVAVIGIIGDGLNSNTRIVSFNSAVKGGQQEVVMCDESDALVGYTPGDLRYQAGVIDTNNFRLKGFDKYLIMRIVRQ